MFTEKSPQRLKAGCQGRDALTIVRRRGFRDLFRRHREQTGRTREYQTSQPAFNPSPA